MRRTLQRAFMKICRRKRQQAITRRFSCRGKNMDVRNAIPNTMSCFTNDGSADCQKCKHIVVFGKIKYCGYCPAHCCLHQIIKESYDPENMKRRCILCENYTLSLSSKKCCECLSTVHLDNFKLAKDIENADWYKNMPEK